jgi:hypothetical protein
MIGTWFLSIFLIYSMNGKGLFEGVKTHYWGVTLGKKNVLFWGIFWKQFFFDCT